MYFVKTTFARMQESQNFCMIKVILAETQGEPVKKKIGNIHFLFFILPTDPLFIFLRMWFCYRRREIQNKHLDAPVISAFADNFPRKIIKINRRKKKNHFSLCVLGFFFCRYRDKIECPRMQTRRGFQRTWTASR